MHPLRRLGHALIVVLAVAAPAGARAAEGPLSDQAIAEAAWSRDATTLTEGTVDPEALVRLAWGLGQLRDEVALPRLSALAAAPEREVRLAALEALAFTPGAAPVLRDRWDEATEPVLQARVLEALGLQGEAEDVDRAVVALAERAPLGPAAARSLGHLARRGIDGAARATRPLIAAVVGTDPRTRAAAAFALASIAPDDLTDAEVERLVRRYRYAPTDAERAWLAQVLMPHLSGAARRSFVLSVLGAPYRMARATVLGQLGPGELSPEDWEGLTRHPDPWVVLQSEAALGGYRADPGLGQARRAVARGEGRAVQRQALVEAARDGTSPRLRSAAAAALLADPTPAPDLHRRLLSAADPVVRELAAADLPATPAALSLAASALQDEVRPPVQRALLQRLAQADTPPPGAAERVAALASTGAFGVRRAAVQTARAWDLPVSTTPATPGPAGLDRSLARAERLVGAVLQTELGTIRIALEPERAPLTVLAFAWLVERGDLEGTPIHRVVPGFVVQTGDARGDGMGHPGWYLPDEPSLAPFEAGAVGLARSAPDTGGSQWFVIPGDQPQLVGRYTRFGRVTQGLDLVRRLTPDHTILTITLERLP